MKYPTLCILDPDKDRCLREEAALDAAIAARGVAANGISNFGACHLARVGTREFPAIDVDGTLFFPREKGGELTYEALCDFLDMLARKGIVRILPR